MRTSGRDILRKALGQGKVIMTAAFMTSFFFNVLRLSGPMFMLLIYDRVLPSRSPETLIVLFAMVAVLLLAMGLFDYSRRRLLVRLAAQFQETVENYIFGSTSKDKFFSRTQTKPVAGLDELDQIRGFINNSSIAILDFVWVPMFLAVVFVLHPVLGFVALGGVLVLLILTGVRAIVTRARFERADAASNTISGLRNLMVASKEILRSQEMTAAFNKRWLSARRSSRDRAIEAKDLSTWFQISIRQIRLILQYSVLATGAYLTLQGELTIGAMVAATFLVVRVILPVESFLIHLPNITKVRRNWNALADILSRGDRYSPPEIHSRFRPDLKVSGLYCRSPLTNEQILRNVTFEAKPGSIIEINGDSGSGKTALAEVILGIWPKSTGKILCGGQYVDRFNSEQSSRIFGYLPERIEFFKGTIAENIAHLTDDIDRERMHEVARQALIHNSIMALPDGYETQIGPMNLPFSRGQQSRIAFARALYHDPKILILDEPDALLRGALAKRLQPMLQEFKAQGGILLLVARRPLGMANTDQMMTLDGGQLKVVELDSNVTSIAQQPTPQNVTTLKKK